MLFSRTSFVVVHQCDAQVSNIICKAIFRETDHYLMLSFMIRLKFEEESLVFMYDNAKSFTVQILC